MKLNSTFLSFLKFLWAAVILICLHTACVAESQPAPPTPSRSVLQTTPDIQPEPSKTETEPIQEAPTPFGEEQTDGILPQSIQYHISAQLDYYRQQVTVEESITLLHPAQKPLVEIVLVVPPNAWLNTFFLQGIALQGVPIQEKVILEGVRLTIPLDQTWQPGQTQELSIQYTLNLPVQNAREGYGPSPFGYTSRQTNLVDWYPMIPPYQEEKGWVIHDPWIFGEYLVYPAADFQVSLEIINGPDLVVAASAEAERKGSQRTYSLNQGRNFVFSISPDYQVLKENSDGTTIYGYYFPLYEIPAQAAFDTTLEALALYSELYGPYQQSSLSMVQADFNHGMEYEGLYFQSQGFFDSYNGSEKSYLITIAAHETAHQWWYGKVANDQALEPWLDEALCTFNELIYYENYYPESAAWWWSTRVNYYQPDGVIDRSIYGFREFTDQYLTYRNATYLQGAKFLDELRKAMGEERFIEFLRNYAERYENQIATGKDFFSLLSAYQDLDSLPWLSTYFSE
jgi:hypothetical protein